jgi:hypothetical protein
MMKAFKITLGVILAPIALVVSCALLYSFDGAFKTGEPFPSLVLTVGETKEDLVFSSGGRYLTLLSVENKSNARYDFVHFGCALYDGEKLVAAEDSAAGIDNLGPRGVAQTSAVIYTDAHRKLTARCRISQAN